MQRREHDMRPGPALKYLALGTILSSFMGGLAAPVAAQGPASMPDLLPPRSEPGKCYMRVQIPAQYESVLETVVKTPAHTQPHVTQAKLKSRTQQVMIKEASVRFEVKQPTFRTVTDKILTRPEYDQLTVVPAQFETIQDTIQTSSARLIWKKGNPGELMRQGYKIRSTADGGRFGQGYRSAQHYGQSGGNQCGEMCEIWCLVEEPGESVTVSRQVMGRAGRVQRTRIPARYETIAKQIVADPGGVRQVTVPAEFRSVTVQDVIEPAREITLDAPEDYGQVLTRKLITEERYEWREARCAPGSKAVGYNPRPARPHSRSVQPRNPSTTPYSAAPQYYHVPTQYQGGSQGASSAYKAGSIFEGSGSAPDYYSATGQKPLIVIPTSGHPASRTLPPPTPTRPHYSRSGYPAITRHAPRRNRGQ